MLGEICERYKGIKITAGQMEKLHNENSEVMVFAGGNTMARLSTAEVGLENIIDKPSVIVKSRGNIDFEFYSGKFTHKNEMWSYGSKNDNILNIKFLYYYLKNNIDYFKNKAITGKLPQISIETTQNFKILLPPLKIQEKIVKILDKFSQISSNLEKGLPKEINLRQKQYEYYRNLLLNFKKD
ncbi:restriction endonuclease subunit S [Campylobacter corcagiensis]|nr:restriction endonuclease subunit S [Campylobacter corcagiensis]